MRRFKRITGLAAAFVITVAAVFPSVTRAAPKKEGPVVVGRVAHIEGELLRYVPEEKDWVPIVKDVPFGLEDTLYSDQDAKAEILFPNSTWIRIGGNTQIQALGLDDEVTEVDVASGMVRLYNRSRQSVVKATTPFGYVVAPEGTMFDLYVGDESLEVIALKGSVDFVHARNESRYEVQSGGSSLVADDRQVTSGQGTVDADFDDWNARRDSLWAKRLEVKGDSTRYLPPQLQDDAYDLEENGRWERVQYEGEYRTLWRPTRVSAGWAPYRTGRWTTYYGDQCWVPYEPFGYVTHHYGSWVFLDTSRSWYWAPPVASINIVVGRPWTVGYGWYPGRVSWIYSDANVGWAPLAPYEPYYAHRYWGPSSVAVATLNLATAVVNLATLHYVDHAVFVGHRDFWGRNNYNNYFVKNINKTTIINNYYGSPVVNNRVIRDFDRRRDRFNFVDRDVRLKPHRSVVERIERNQRLAERQERLEARDLMREARNVRAGDLARDARVERPKVSNRLVSKDSVDRPLKDVRFEERELKRQERQQRAVDDRVLRQQRDDRQQQQREDRLQQREERQQLQREDKQQLQREDRLQQREDRQQRQQELREQRQRGREPGVEGEPGAERRQGTDRVRPERPSRESLEQRRLEREERRRGRDEDSPDTQQQREERLQRQQQREERLQRQQGQEQQRQQREERQQMREERAPEVEQRRQLREQQDQERLQRQQQQEQQRQQREERQQQMQQQEQQRQQREERLQRQQQQEQQRQQREERQQQMQQQEQQRQQREERLQRQQQQEQQRQQREERQQREIQQREERLQRQQQQEQQRQQREERQQMQQQRQMREERQQPQEQQRQQRQQQQEQQRQKKQRGQEDQQGGGILPPQ